MNLKQKETKLKTALDFHLGRAIEKIQRDPEAKYLGEIQGVPVDILFRMARKWKTKMETKQCDELGITSMARISYFPLEEDAVQIVITSRPSLNLVLEALNHAN